MGPRPRTISALASKRSIWTQPHFVMAVAAQFFYVAAQAGIFSFFINYMTSQVPAISGGVSACAPTDRQAVDNKQAAATRDHCDGTDQREKREINIQTFNG